MGKEPDFVNPEGTRWWLEKNLTYSARQKLNDTCRVYKVEKKDGTVAYLLLEGDNILDEELHSFEGMAVKIDKHMLLRRES